MILRMEKMAEMQKQTVRRYRRMETENDGEKMSISAVKPAIKAGKRP